MDMTTKQVPKAIRRVFARYISESRGGRPLGRDGRIRVNYFLDLLTAAHVEKDLQVIAKAFASHLTKNVDLSAYDAIVAPKRGNSLLAKAVAEILCKPSAFVKESMLFGRWVEGSVASGDKALLVDDIGSDGELLGDAASGLRHSGIYADQVWVVVSRSEGDANYQLSELGITYRFMFELNDNLLASMTQS